MDTTTIYIIAGAVFFLFLLCVCCCLGLCGISAVYRKKASERARAAAAARRKRANKTKKGEAGSIAAAQPQPQPQQSLQMVPYVQTVPQPSVYANPPPIIYPQQCPPSQTIIYPPQPPAYCPQESHRGSYPQPMSMKGQGQPSSYPSTTNTADLSSSESSLTAYLANSINRLTKHLQQEADDPEQLPDNSEHFYARRGSTPSNVYLDDNRSSNHSVLTKTSMLVCANADAFLESLDDIGVSDLPRDFEGGESNQQISYAAKSQPIRKEASHDPSSISQKKPSFPTNHKLLGDQRSVLTASTLKSFSVVIGQLGEQEIIDITTSPGVLGIVLDASDEGWPIIRKIKLDSVLLDQVSVGDRVMSVDGKDARNITIGEASGLLNKFSGKSRMVTVLRKESTSADV